MAVPECNDVRSLQHALACPVCKGRLDFSPNVISCTACGLVFDQPQDDYLNLLPRHLLENDQSNWDIRQQEMEGWYRDLTHQKWAVGCFKNDYGPYSSLLATLTGTVLDIGGGNGIIRHYIPESVRYITIEPSLEWFGKEWGVIAGAFPCLNVRPCFIRGVGEYLPFTA